MRKNTAIALLTTVVSAGSFAAEDVMVVTASGYEQKKRDAAASISVISQEELSKQNYTDLASALSDVEGLDVRSTTGKTGGLILALEECQVVTLLS